MTYNKIGFHAGAGGNMRGYGDYVRTLDQHGIPAVCMSVGGNGLGDIVAQWDAGSTVPHVACVRYMPSDGSEDVPPYGTDEKQAAAIWWQWTKPKIGSEVIRHRDKIWIKVGNELDKERIGWLSRFYLHLADIMQSDKDGPFKLVAFNFSAGEPEYEDWEDPDALRYLQRCAEQPDLCAIGVHEYSLANELDDGIDYLVGRFWMIHETCDKHGIARPKILIHEFGWRQNVAPEPSIGMPQIPAIAELYARHPNILGAGMWTLQKWHDGTIWDTVQRYIEPITNYSLAAKFAPVQDVPTPPDTNPVEEEPKQMKKKQIDVIELPPNALTSTVVLQRDTGEHVIWNDTRIVADYRAEKNRPNRLRIITVYEEEEEQKKTEIPFGALGVDVSFWQGLFDWETVIEKGVRFAYIRCSDGMHKNTSSHDENGADRELWRNAEALTSYSGVAWGVYHFLRPSNIELQAEKVITLLDMLASKGHSPRSGQFDDGTWLPEVMIDVETSELTNAQILQFFNMVSERYTCGIYTSAGYWNAITKGHDNWWSGLPCWTADYGQNDGTKPSRDPIIPVGFNACHIWQYTSLGGEYLGWKSQGLDVNAAGVWRRDDPVETPPPAPTIPTHDLVEYMIGSSTQFEVRHPDGSQERVSHQPGEGNDWFVVKGEQQGFYEHWHYDNEYIYLVEDSSPANADDGTERFYRVSKNGDISPWAKRHMSEGETFNDGGHFVQFYREDNCEPHPQNSGNAANNTTFVGYWSRYEFETGIALDDVIAVKGNTETHFYARGYGRVAWVSPWGQSTISEIHAPGARPVIERRPVGCK